MTTTPIETLEDALDYLAPKHCGACGESLDPPGSPCAACGMLPKVTRPELAEQLLAEPGHIARIEGERQDAEAVAEARRLRAEAAERIAEAERLFRAADATDYRAVLRRRRDAAEGAFQAAVGMRQQLAAEFAQAVVDEEAAHEPLADAFAIHKAAEEAEETARRMRTGPLAETEALVRLDAAAKVLARHREEARGASRAREVAEAALRVAGQNLNECEDDRAAAVADLTRCAPVPLSAETVRAAALPLLRIAAGKDINGQAMASVERAQAAVFGQTIETLATMEYHAAMASMERARRAEEDRLVHAPQLRQLGDGMLSAAWASPPPVPDGASGGVITPPPDLSPAKPFFNTGEGPLPGAAW